MKSIRISFMLSPNQLAKTLAIIRQTEPTYQLLSHNDLIKTIIHNFITQAPNQITEPTTDQLNEISQHKNSKPLSINTLLSPTYGSNTSSKKLTNNS